MIIKTIKSICQISDIHIRKNPNRNLEYEEAFENLYKSLKLNKPDVIAIPGDIFNDFIDLQGEQLILAKKFLNSLAEIAPVRLTRGNHDIFKSNLNRVDSIEAIVNLIDNPNIDYYHKTGFYFDENIIWAVWHWGDKKPNPWLSKDTADIELKRKEGYTVIDLYHESIDGCVDVNNKEMKSKSMIKLDEFKGDYLFSGHIHQQQYLDVDKRKCFSGSLIAQTIAEGDDHFHGYVLWNLTNNTSKLIPITTKWSKHNVILKQYVDFDDLNIDIENPTEIMDVRFIWKTLPQTRSKDNERKLSEYILKKYKNTKIFHKNDFIVDDKINISKTVTLENITNVTVQHNIFTEYLSKIGVEESMIEDILKLDLEISKGINISDILGGDWDILKFGCENFMSYGSFDIDWRSQDGLYQIVGENFWGKTTILKLIQYVLYGKCLETDYRLEHGNKRFVNNRNAAKFTEGYVVLESCGSYYGLKRRTDLSFAKDGSINGAPTVLNYYLLTSADDNMDDTNSLDVLDEERRALTQKKIDMVIGSYDNFHRAVMTTSDTLNRILSNDMATFVDSLLNDSGLDIFDLKTKALKQYKDKQNNAIRVSCDVNAKNKENLDLDFKIKDIDTEILDIEDKVLPEIKHKIETGRTFIETTTKKLFKIDSEIYNLNIQDTQTKIDRFNSEIKELDDRLDLLKESMIPLCEAYDEARLNELIEKRDNHKTKVYELNLEIKKHEQSIRDESHANEIIRGEIFNLKKSGAEKKEEIQKLAKSKTCPTCGQKMTAEHLVHVNEAIKVLEEEMFKLADQIKQKNEVEIPIHDKNMVMYDNYITDIKFGITTMTDGMEIVLTEIGTLNNLKNDVQKRKDIQAEVDTIPIKIQNKKLNVEILQKKIDDHTNSLLQIEENNKIENIIVRAKQKVGELEDEENDKKRNLYQIKIKKETYEEDIKNNLILIEKFKKQEYRDSVINTYAKTIHRDGVPKTLLVNNIIPKINENLSELLSIASFKVYLDSNDLRPKFIHNKRPDAIIDAISSSGAERTFTSIPLKFALNQINIKSKPTIQLMDEIMNKLDDNSMEIFIEVLQLIKTKMKKVLVIEHNRSIDPDYIIEVKQDDEGISSLSIT